MTEFHFIIEQNFLEFHFQTSCKKRVPITEKYNFKSAPSSAELTAIKDKKFLAADGEC